MKDKKQIDGQYQIRINLWGKWELVITLVNWKRAKKWLKENKYYAK